MDYDLGRAMDSLSLLVVAIGSVLIALVTYLGVSDYLHPVSDVKLRGVYARRTPKQRDGDLGLWQFRADK